MGQVYGQLYDTWLKFNNPWTPRFRAKDVTDFHAGAVQELKALDALQKLELAKKDVVYRRVQWLGFDTEGC